MKKRQEAPSWRHLRPSDLPALVRLADEMHPDARERAEVFEEKLDLFPDGCFAFEGGGGLLGYAISHPWVDNDIPSLDAFLDQLPDAPDCLFLHDVAIAAERRGRGATATLIEQLTDIAKRERLPSLALVSMYGTEPLWRRRGFDCFRSDALSVQLAKYGAAAVYMKKII
ncbi:GNAT family N-acetyltransferase [Methylocystis sp. IM3]|uniref:GNAT family N-acetyltransferase n=1 Tax=unclassified Methylocystis TaxID=2625913 RepID=UPI0030F88DE9